MNWGNIRFNYQEAFRLLLNEKHWVWQDDNQEVCYTHEMDSFVNTRDLYTFFDEQKIYIDIHYHWEYQKETRIWFAWKILSKQGFKTAQEPYFSRTEAEEKAFEKAFSILEEKLGEK